MLLPFGPNGSKLDILEIPPFGIKKILQDFFFPHKNATLNHREVRLRTFCRIVESLALQKHQLI